MHPILVFLDLEAC